MRSLTRTLAPEAVGATATTPRSLRSASADDAEIGPPRSSSASRPSHSSAAMSCGRPKAWSTPRWSTAIRSARRPASPRKWVQSTTVRPCSVASAPMRSITSRVAAGSRPEVGSSRNSTSGSWSRARARARRLRWPVDVPWTGTSARSAMPKRSSRSLVRRSDHARSRPRIRAVSTRFSRAVRRSSRPACSVRTPVRRRTAVAVHRRIDAEHLGAATVGHEDPVEEAHGGGLAGAVRAEEREHLALLHLEGEAVERHPAGERPREVGRCGWQRSSG